MGKKQKRGQPGNPGQFASENRGKRAPNAVRGGSKGPKQSGNPAHKSDSPGKVPHLDPDAAFSKYLEKKQELKESLEGSWTLIKSTKVKTGDLINIPKGVFRVTDGGSPSTSKPWTVEVVDADGVTQKLQMDSAGSIIRIEEREQEPKESPEVQANE